MSPDGQPMHREIKFYFLMLKCHKFYSKNDILVLVSQPGMFQRFILKIYHQTVPLQLVSYANDFLQHIICSEAYTFRQSHLLGSTNNYKHQKEIPGLLLEEEISSPENSPARHQP